MSVSTLGTNLQMRGQESSRTSFKTTSLNLITENSHVFNHNFCCSVCEGCELWTPSNDNDWLWCGGGRVDKGLKVSNQSLSLSILSTIVLEVLHQFCPNSQSERLNILVQVSYFLMKYFRYNSLLIKKISFLLY